jgi:hypothetical protein
VNCFTYTEEEYRRLLQELDIAWSKEDTDLLFSLCAQFDLRFHIIHDRYDAVRQRTLEVLQILLILFLLSPNEKMSLLILNFCMDYVFLLGCVRAYWVLQKQNKNKKKINRN